MIGAYKADALVRLKTARGHLGAVIDMVEAERYCPELMKQVAAIQASLEKINRILLRNHLETCVSEAIKTGAGREKIDELLEALQFNSSLTDLRHLVVSPAREADQVGGTIVLNETGVTGAARGAGRPKRSTPVAQRGRTAQQGQQGRTAEQAERGQQGRTAQQGQQGQRGRTAEQAEQGQRGRESPPTAPAPPGKRRSTKRPAR